MSRNDMDCECEIAVKESPGFQPSTFNLQLYPLLYRKISAADYPALQELWHAHGMPSVPFDVLPRFGCVGCDGVRIVAAVYCYIDTTSPVAVLGFAVADPAFPARMRHAALSGCVNEIAGFCREVGQTYLVSAFSGHGLNAICRRAGMIPTDRGVTLNLRRA